MMLNSKSFQVYKASECIFALINVGLGCLTCFRGFGIPISQFVLLKLCIPHAIQTLKSISTVNDGLFIASEGVTFLFPVLPTDQLTPTWQDVFALAFYRLLG